MEIDQLVDLLDIEKKATVKDIISSRSGVFVPASNGGDMRSLAPERGTVNPGEFWLYNNWDFNMAGHIFEKKTNRNIYDEIESQFSIPLGMQDWNKSLQEKSGDALISEFPAYHIWFSTRDMARLGLLMLNNGMWGDKRIIEESWVKEMTSPKSSFEELDSVAPFLKSGDNKFSYGYMWWLWENDKNEMLKGAYSAQGAWGQNITILPEMNTVIAIKTNDLYYRQKGDHHYLIDLISQSYDSNVAHKMQGFAEFLKKNDIQAFVDGFRANKPQETDIDFEDAFNRMGYALLESKDVKNAVKIFELNTEMHPDSWNLFDSLGEGYFLLGDYTKSIENYKKAVTLNADNISNNNDRVELIIRRIENKLKSASKMN
ncbi:serine hydrolase [Aureibacter tunicatorum]|uniref:serine hydrolase n=1 Tax=Aureibacter tunicatorum TaxID=866807 RepID=UPI0030CA13C5